MSVESEYKRAEGAYALPKMDKKVVVFTVPSEDVGKVEGYEKWRQMKPINPGMYGVVSGKIDDGDRTFADALAREAYEEQGLVKFSSQFTNGLPLLHILQQRPEGKYRFTVHGHEFPITESEVAHLHETRGTVQIDEDQLSNFLFEQSAVLRPSVHAMLALYINYLERRQRGTL